MGATAASENRKQLDVFPARRLTLLSPRPRRGKPGKHARFSLRDDAFCKLKLSLQRGGKFREGMGNGLRLRVTQNEDHNHESDRKHSQ